MTFDDHSPSARRSFVGSVAAGTLAPAQEAGCTYCFAG